jgi:hypothetical protein
VFERPLLASVGRISELRGADAVPAPQHSSCQLQDHDHQDDHNEDADDRADYSAIHVHPFVRTRCARLPL